jgi:pimeloyl-ACP methyl ester carboxylesterase
MTEVSVDEGLRGGVLVLPGGKPESTMASGRWQLANQRMGLLARSLRHRLGSGVHVAQVQYRLRGWNNAQFDALRDAGAALDGLRDRFDPAQIVLVGHSMGGRVAAHLSAREDVGAVAALAPWWPRDDGDLVPACCRLLVVHGTADTRTDPGSSRAQTRRARERGVDAQWIGIDDAGHYMLRQWRRWHGLTAEFAAAQLRCATKSVGGEPPESGPTGP